MEQPGNMMPNGMQQRHMNTMQRPQPGNGSQQLHAKIIDNLQQKASLLPQGWQATFDIRERALFIMQIITQLRFLHQDVARCLNIAEGFEDRTVKESPNKEVYKERMHAKMGEITQHRQNNAQQQNMQNLQMGMPMNNNGGMGMTPNNMGSLNMMQNMGVGGMGMGLGMGTNMNMNGGVDMSNMNMGMPNMQMGANGGQQNSNFPTHLQRQMQPSPLPQHAQPQQPNNTLDPSALRNPQMPPQMQNMNQQQAMAMNQNNQLQGKAPTDEEIKQRANQMFISLPEEKKRALRAQIWNQMSEQQRQQSTNGGMEMVLKFMANRAREQLIREKAGNQNSQPQQNPGGMQMGNNMGVAPNQLQQPQSTQPGQANIDFSKITDLRANAIKSQESGGEVVPASNHTNFNLAGQMNMPQGVNPQMMGNANGQNGGNPNAQQMQMLAAQRERQKAILQQQALARQQAQNNLRGQPGGLSTPNALNGGQVNSPGMNMSMLNRPMAPPGQTTPSTPQHNRPQAMSHTPMNPTNQLQQHHQTMLNQNQTMNSQQMQQILQSLPPNYLENMPLEARQKLATLQPAQLREVLSRIGAQNGQPRPGGMGNAMPNMPGPQMGNQQPGNNGVQPGMGNAVPNFTSQPPPNQQNARPNQDMMGLQRIQQQQQMQFKQRALDMRPFPRNLLQSLGMQVPDAVDTWGKLKHHIVQNQTVLPPNILSRVQSLQVQWFDAHPEEVQAAMQELSRRVQQQQQLQKLQQNQQAQQPTQQPPSTQPPMSMPMPNGQAPAAQMVPPTAPMMQQPPMQNQNQNQNLPQNQTMPGQNPMQGQQRLPQWPPATEAEIKKFREQYGSRAEHFSDEQVKEFILKMKREAFVRQRMQQGQQALAAATQANMAQAAQQQQQPPLSRPPQGQNPQAAAAPAQGQKRPQSSNDDIVEISRPSAPPVNNMAQMAAAQQGPGQQMFNRQGGMKIPTQEELDKMDPTQRQRMQQMAALRKAQSEAAQGQVAAMNQQQPQPSQFGQQQPRPNPNQPQPPNLTPEMMQERNKDRDKLAAMIAETNATTHKGPAVNVTADELEQARSILKKLKPTLDKIDLTYPAALHWPNMGEQRVRGAMKIKANLMLNIDPATGALKDYLSIPLQELKGYEAFLGKYLSTIAQLQKARNGNAAAAANGARPAQQPPAPAAPTAVKQEQQQAPPLNRKASQTQGRKQSANSKAPPAPTENKTFDWAVQSPQGIPKYEPGLSELTQEKLKIPAAKKRKTGPTESANSTPTAQTGAAAANVASPAGMGAPKPPTPEQMRKMQAQVAQRAEAVRPKFRCDDPTCEGSVAGFETEEALKAHREVEHVVVEDPFKFLIDSTEEFVKAEEGKAMAGSKMVGLPGGKVGAGNKALGKIAGARPASSTPTPTPSGKAAGKTLADKKAAETPIVQLTDEASAQEKKLLDVMAEKINFELPPPEQDPSLLGLPTTEGEDSAWTEMIASQFQGADGWVDDWSQFRGVTDWGLGPDLESSPELTPSSSDSQTSRESDISNAARLKINMQWDAWADGDTGIPAEFDLALGGLVVEDGAVGEDGKKIEGDGMDWSSGLGSWESLFGPDAGVDPAGDWAAGLNVMNA